MTTPESLVRLLAVLTLFRVLGHPLACLAFPGMVASRYALATSLALGIATHITWLLAHLGLAIGGLSIALGVAAVAMASVAAWRRGGGNVRTAWPTPGTAVSHHVATSLAFALALLITARNPSVDPDSERPMDLAMVNAVVASRALPLEDPWLAGERVSYYDYGYYATAYLAIVSGIDTAHFFPLAVALLFASLLGGMLAVGRDLAGWGGGLGAAWLVAVAGNLDALWQTLRRVSLFDWFSAARVIHGGVITEFPFFSLLWGDLHPYGMALPYWPPLLAVAIAISRSRVTRWTLVAAAFAYAALLATHTWDAVPIAVVLVLAASPSVRRQGIAALAPACAVLLGGALLAVPYLQAVPTGGRGLQWVSSPSTLVELFTMWGVPCLVLAVSAWRSAVACAAAGWLAPSLTLAALLVVFPAEPGAALVLLAALAAMVLALRADPCRSLQWLLAAVGLGLVFGVEILFVDDVYSGDLERMNTVFKAYIEAWVLLGVAAATLGVDVARRWWSGGGGTRLWLVGAAALVLAVSGIYPLRATVSRCGDLWRPAELDARVALRARYPDDAAAVELLRRAPRGVILEATGGPYTWDGRFATFTGFPTVVGWAHHEAGWRNSWKLLTPRVADVTAAYETLDGSVLETILTRYRVRYVVVGELERARFPAAGLAKFERLPVEVRSGDTVVYRVGAG